MRLEKPCGLSLVEHTARSLRQAIQSGHLKPGSRLVESAIADEMGISRGPVREAIQQLAGEGLLEIHPRRGAVVRGLDAKTAYEVQTLRGVLEGFAARLCADRLSEQRADALRRQLQTLMSAAEAGDVAAFVEADVAFHGSIVDFADHHRLSLAFHALNPLHGVACNFGLSPGEALITSSHRQRRLLAALLSGDAGLAEAMVMSHYEEQANLFMSRLSGRRTIH